MHADAGAGPIRQPARANVNVDSLLAPPNGSENTDAMPLAAGARFAVDTALSAFSAQHPSAPLHGFVAVRHSQKW